MACPTVRIAPHCASHRPQGCSYGLFALRREAATVLMDNSNARHWHAWVSNRWPHLYSRSCCCAGKAILSGWSDGKIRAFGPQSGKLLYVINDAHQGGVTAIAVCNEAEQVLSGGADGQVHLQPCAAMQ